MIHYQAIADLKDRIDALQGDRGYYCPGPEKDAEMVQEIQDLEEELKKLEKEADDYREGYEAGRDFYMDGVPMKDEWAGRGGQFYRGFTAAGDDS